MRNGRRRLALKNEELGQTEVRLEVVRVGLERYAVFARSLCRAAHSSQEIGDIGMDSLPARVQLCGGTQGREGFAALLSQCQHQTVAMSSSRMVRLVANGLFKVRA